MKAHESFDNDIEELGILALWEHPTRLPQHG